VGVRAVEECRVTVKVWVKKDGGGVFEASEAIWEHYQTF
jgi:hypothetical protein